jgi:hypothetical protein
MATKPIRFMQIAVNTDHIYGLDEEGEVWYRDKIPYTVTTYHNSYTTADSNKEKEKKEQATLWKPLRMDARVELKDNGPPLDIPLAPGLVTEPVVPATTTATTTTEEKKDEDFYS